MSYSKSFPKEDIEAIVDKKLADHDKRLKEKFKYFIYGLVSLIFLIIITGLITKRNLIILVHDTIFNYPNKTNSTIQKILSSEVAISYHRSFWLENPDQPNEKMLFYASPSQRVQVYIESSHYGTSIERRKVIAWLNETELGNPKADFKGGFKDITKKLFNEESSFSIRGENIHLLEFGLDQTQPIDLNDKVYIDCVIIVFGIELKK